MNQITDERFYVVEEAICDAFMKIVNEKELDKITVSDVIKTAGIVRSTFYNHYENIPALIAGMQDRTVNEISALMENFRPKNDYDLCKSYFQTLCEYTMTNPFLSKLLISPEGDEFFEKAMKMFGTYIKEVTQTTASDPVSKTEHSYAVACAIGATVGLLHKWTRDGYKESPDMVADIITRSFMTGILPLLS